MTTSLSLENRFERHIIRHNPLTDPDGCDIWIGGKHGDGYGQFHGDGKMVKAHRLAYELAYGPIPDGLEILHQCPHGSRRDCVNPAHLAAGTHRENMDDMMREHRQSHGEAHPRAKLTDDQVRQIREMSSTGKYSQIDLARMFGVSNGHLSGIIHGRYRKSA